MPEGRCPSLLSMTQRAIIRSISCLTDVGDEISYETIRPVLKRIIDPDQLKRIEDNSPHIADHDGELWRAFIVRDCPAYCNDIPEPKNPRSWWKVYRKLLRETRQMEEASLAALKRTMNGISTEKEANQVKFAGEVIKPDRRMDYIEAPQGSSGVCITAVKQKVAHELRLNSRGESVLDGIRKQGMQARKEKGLLPRTPPFTKSTRMTMQGKQSYIAKAPESMINQHRAAAATAPRLEATTSAQSKPAPGIARQIEERERRLRALTGLAPTRAASNSNQPSSVEATKAASQSSPTMPAASPPKSAVPQPDSVPHPPRVATSHLSSGKSRPSPTAPPPHGAGLTPIAMPAPPCNTGSSQIVGSTFIRRDTILSTSPARTPQKAQRSTAPQQAALPRKRAPQAVSIFRPVKKQKIRYT